MAERIRAADRRTARLHGIDAAAGRPHPLAGEQRSERDLDDRVRAAGFHRPGAAVSAGGAPRRRPNGWRVAAKRRRPRKRRRNTNWAAARPTAKEASAPVPVTAATARPTSAGRAGKQGPDARRRQDQTSQERRKGGQPLAYPPGRDLHQARGTETQEPEQRAEADQETEEVIAGVSPSTAKGERRPHGAFALSRNRDGKVRTHSVGPKNGAPFATAQAKRAGRTTTGEEVSGIVIGSPEGRKRKLAFGAPGLRSAGRDPAVVVAMTTTTAAPSTRCKPWCCHGNSRACSATARVTDLCQSTRKGRVPGVSWRPQPARVATRRPGLAVPDRPGPRTPPSPSCVRTLPRYARQSANSSWDRPSSDLSR